ncbi:MAG: DUF1905 domain-containing protein [Acidobacteriota bacterium]
MVKVLAKMDGRPFRGSLMALGDGTHKPSVKANIRQAIRKEGGDTVRALLEKRIEEIP